MKELDIGKRKKLIIAIDNAILGSIELRTFFREKSVGFVLEVDLVSNTWSVVQVEHEEEEKQRSRKDTIILAC